VKGFNQPSGVVDVQLDKATNRLATPSCPDTYTAAFVAGTEPSETCDQMNGIKGFFSRVLGLGNQQVVPPGSTQANSGTNGQPNGTDAPKKKGLFGKIAGIFKDDKSSNPPKPAEDDNAPQH